MILMRNFALMAKCGTLYWVVPKAECQTTRRQAALCKLRIYERQRNQLVHRHELQHRAFTC